MRTHYCFGYNGQRIQWAVARLVGRQMQLEYKKRLAKVLAGVEEQEGIVNEMTGYFARVFALPEVVN